VWLRQPGFDLPFLPHDEEGATTPDEPAMAALGDAMAGATGWESDRAWVLGDITGATEDWNYFSQGTYGYTPEIRGPNFHANYAEMVVEEYVGDAAHAGRDVRDAFLIAGERAARAADHSVIEGTAPPGATLRLHKEFETETCGGDPDCAPENRGSIHDVLDTRLTVRNSGEYTWHVNPSGRPLFPGEVWTMSCQVPGEEERTTTVSVDRGERARVNWSDMCEPPPQPGAAGSTCRGRPATIIGTPGDDSRAAVGGTRGRDVIAAGNGRDKVRSRGRRDLVCAGAGRDKVRGGKGADVLLGERGRDRLSGNRGRDRLRGGRGRDRCRGGPGKDRRRSC
jgi:hypothetical protein